MSRSFELLTEACALLPVTVRKMFGGHGFFAPNGGMFAGIVSDDQAILKLTDARALTELVALGGHAWTYEGKGAPVTMASWIVVPEAFYDDLELFAQWASRAHRLVPAKKQTKPKPLAAAKPKSAVPKKVSKKAPKSVGRPKAVSARK